MECLEFYTIRPGDTFYIISRETGIPLRRLLEINPDVDPDRLQVGQRICLRAEGETPRPPEPPSQGISCPIGSVPYTVRAGDTFAKIAMHFGTTVEAIKNLNPDADPFNLQVGDRLCIAQPIGDEPDCPEQNFYVIRRGDTIGSIAAAFGVSQRELLTANPSVVPTNLQVGQVICIPLAPSPVEIVINRGAKRMTVYKNGRVFREYVVAVGKEETPTPTGVFTVINKQVNPGGPYGTRWLGLSRRGYGIHGTNDPASIGYNASNGCVRMFNEDVEALFDITPVGTVVRILP